MKKIIPLTAALLTPLALLAQEKKGPYESNFELPGSRAEVYKTIGDVKLKIYIYEPKGHKAGVKRPAIVFFFGGGWRGGTPKQFLEHCRYLASKGMVAMTADYRVSSRQGTKPFHCVRDGKSAVRWVRQNARRLGIDPGASRPAAARPGVTSPPAPARCPSTTSRARMPRSVPSPTRWYCSIRSSSPPRQRG